MTVKAYISPRAELLWFSLEDNFVQTTGGGTGEDVGINDPEEEW